jgi:hypothetical protein
MLHLGSSASVKGEELQEGMEFNSRPINLTFFYKYIPKNSADYGMVEIWIKDASGNIIAQGSKQLASTNYERAIIPLSYSINTPKAAMIYVKFVSSANEACLARNKNNFNCPSVLNSATFMGSQLLIDDISLTY